jgi:integral membrane protein
MTQSLTWLHRFALADGIALLLLVFVAVPLKYNMDFPYLVKVLGPTHGVLFLSMTFLIIKNVSQKALPIKLGFALFFGALVPLGAFIADHFLRRHVRAQA